MIPEQIGVYGSAEWEKKDTSGIKDYKAIEVKMDWTFCTPYKGFAKRILEPGPFLQKLQMEAGASEAFVAGILDGMENSEYREKVLEYK